ERKRRHRLLPAREPRQALHLLARRVDLDLDPEQIFLGLALGLGPVLPIRLGPILPIWRRWGVGTAQHPCLPLAVLDQTQAAPATREQLRDHLLEIVCGSR